MEVFHVAFQKICSCLSFEHVLCHKQTSYIALQLKFNQDNDKFSMISDEDESSSLTIIFQITYLFLFHRQIDLPQFSLPYLK